MVREEKEEMVGKPAEGEDKNNSDKHLDHSLDQEGDDEEYNKY